RRLVPRSVSPRTRGNCACCVRRAPDSNRTPRCRTLASCARSCARMASFGDLPNIRWLKERLGKKYNDSYANLRIQTPEEREHLISHQPPYRYCVRRIAQAGTRSTEFVSCEQLRDRPSPAQHRIHLRKTAL